MDARLTKIIDGVSAISDDGDNDPHLYAGMVALNEDDFDWLITTVAHRKDEIARLTEERDQACREFKSVIDVGLDEADVRVRRLLAIETAARELYFANMLRTSDHWNRLGYALGVYTPDPLWDTWYKPVVSEEE